MKLSSGLVLACGVFFGCSTAEASPPPSGSFNITNFYVSAIPHSQSVAYQFDATTIFNNQTASCSGYAYTNPDIGTVPLSNCSLTQAKWYFNVTKNGFLLDVQRYVTRGRSKYLLEGQKRWPQSVAVVFHSPPDNPFPYERMNVSTHFKIPYSVKML